MSNLNSAYENYYLTHTNFVEAYKMVNDYVTELYRLPKRFLDETEGTMNLITSKHFTPKSPSENDKSMRFVAEFMDQLDEFTVHTIDLFNDHISHIEATEAYMKKVMALEAKGQSNGNDEIARQSVELVPTINTLMAGLKNIKERADDTLAWLEKLEVRWEDVQEKVRSAA